MILRTTVLLEKNPKPTEQEIVEELNGNVCRCCGYPRILEAVKRASAMAESSETQRKEATRDAAR
jgi:aerobic-type carbon monoxide dehydrogenase small subunit (CoxS/CutS family)